MEGLSGLSVQGDGMLRERGCVGALEHLGRVDHSPGGAGEEALERVALVQDREELTQAVDHLREVDVDPPGEALRRVPRRLAVAQQHERTAHALLLPSSTPPRAPISTDNNILENNDTHTIADYQP